MADQTTNNRNGKKRSLLFSFLRAIKDVAVIAGIIYLLVLFTEIKIDIGLLKGRFADIERTQDEILKLHPRTMGGQ